MITSARTHPTIFPELRYQDADAAITFLKTALGFTEHVVYRSGTGAVTHAELRLGPSIIMVGQDPYDDLSAPVTICVFVEDPDAVYAQAMAGGAEIIREPEDKHYGSRDFVVRDPGGNLWVFGTYDPYAVWP